MENWTIETTSSVKESVAAGEIISVEDKSTVQLDNLLDRFLTGTEKTKTWGRQGKLTNSSSQGPIDVLCFDSPAKKAKNLKERNKTTHNIERD
jgi:hypothetical protein